MALPTDLTTFTLHLGQPPYTDASGNLIPDMTGKLVPVDPVTGKPLRLVHVTEGGAILPKPVDVQIVNGTGSVGPLPHTDNPSLSMVGWLYELTWNVGSNKPSPGNKRFAVPAAAGTSVDFDLLDVAESVPGVLVPIGEGPQGDKGDPGSLYPMVVHGDDPNVARPASSLPVIWFGTVDPLNADDTKDITIPLGDAGDGFEVAASDSSVAALVAAPTSDTAAALRAALVLPKVGGYTYNTDGTVASGPDGETYAYNSDGTVHSVTLNGVTRTYAYDANLNVTAVA